MLGHHLFNFISKSSILGDPSWENVYVRIVI